MAKYIEQRKQVYPSVEERIHVSNLASGPTAPLVPLLLWALSWSIS